MPISHDRIFKQFLERFLPQFMQVFFPRHAARLDLSSYRVGNQELMVAAPEIQVRLVDFVAEVATRDGAPELILIHIEIESGAWRRLPRRMHEYYTLLRIVRGKAVLPLALVLQPGADGLSWQAYEEALFEEPLLYFRYGQVALRDLDPQPYLASGDPVAAALTALMNLSNNDPALVKLTALQTVTQSSLTDGDKRLLINMIGTYMPTVALPPAGAELMTALREIEKMWLDEAEERGRAEGREEGVRISILTLLENRFGAGAVALAARVAQVEEIAELQRLLLLAALAPALADFEAALRP